MSLEGYIYKYIKGTSTKCDIHLDVDKLKKI